MQSTVGSEIIIYVILGGILLLAIWIIVMYNNLVRLRLHVRDSWSAIETELKRRYDLIPNLVETVRGYAQHEKKTLSDVIEARNRAVSSTGSPQAQAKDENALIGCLRQLFALAENYPNLKANENFLNLQQELSNTEDRIQASRRFYNGNVREYNTMIAVFPSNIIAGTFGFGPEEFFEVEDAAVRNAPQVKFS
jgi:LemA protein